MEPGFILTWKLLESVTEIKMSIELLRLFATKKKKKKESNQRCCEVFGAVTAAAREHSWISFAREELGESSGPALAAMTTEMCSKQTAPKPSTATAHRLCQQSGIKIKLFLLSPFPFDKLSSTLQTWINQFLDHSWLHRQEKQDKRVLAAVLEEPAAATAPYPSLPWKSLRQPTRNQGTTY